MYGTSVRKTFYLANQIIFIHGLTKEKKTYFNTKQFFNT
jgi:hypothetical protein